MVSVWMPVQVLAGKQVPLDDQHCWVVQVRLMKLVSQGGWHQTASASNPTQMLAVSGRVLSLQKQAQRQDPKRSLIAQETTIPDFPDQVQESAAWAALF
jgi:hypothetical protein